MFADEYQDQECFAHHEDAAGVMHLDAYGMSWDGLGDVVTGVAGVQRRVTGYEKSLAERGLQPQAEWVANGDLDVIEKWAQWTEANRQLFV